MSRSEPTITLVTPRQPGAIALIQLHGDGAGALLRRLTGRADWPAGRLRLADLGGMDTGLAGDSMSGGCSSCRTAGFASCSG